MIYHEDKDFINQIAVGVLADLRVLVENFFGGLKEQFEATHECLGEINDSIEYLAQKTQELKEVVRDKDFTCD